MSKLVKFGDYLCGVDNPLLRWNGVKRCLDVTHNDDSNDYSDDRRARQYRRHLSSVSACSRYDAAASGKARHTPTIRTCKGVHAILARQSANGLFAILLMFSTYSNAGKLPSTLANILGCVKRTCKMM